MATINKSTNNKCWWGCWEWGTLVHCWWEGRSVQPLWGTVWRILKKLKWNCLMTQWLYFLVYIWRNPNTNLKEYMHLYVHCSIIYNSQTIEATQVPINRWLAKEVMVHIYNGILFSHKNKEILPLAIAWMDLEGVILSEIS